MYGNVVCINTKIYAAIKKKETMTFAANQKLKQYIIMINKTSQKNRSK